MSVHEIELVIMSQYPRSVIPFARSARDIATGNVMAILELAFFEDTGYYLPSIRHIRTNIEQA